MNSTDLAFFSAVAGAGGMGRAASALNTVQSNVTAHIRALETELGAPLFHRSKKGVTLTAAGERLLPYARQVAQLLREAQAVVSDDSVPAGTLRIGSLETTAAIRLPALLGRYAAAYPEVSLSIETGPTQALVEAVLERRLDGAFVTGPIAHADLEAVPVIKERLVLVTPPAVRTPDDLSAYLARPCGAKIIVFRAGCSYRQRMEEVLAQRGIVDVRLMELGTLDGILGCVGANVGITLLPWATVAVAAESGRIAIHELEPAMGSATTLFIHRRDAFLSCAMRRLKEEAVAMFGSGAPAA